MRCGPRRLSFPRFPLHLQVGQHIVATRSGHSSVACRIPDRSGGTATLSAVSRRAKIVCTIGPVTATPEKIRELVRAGMDVARLNFSHGTHAEHERVYSMVREASDESGKAVGILADLQGPKIRLGRFADGPVEWRTGDEVRVTVEDVPGTHDRVSTTYEGLAKDAREGDRLLVDDGKVALLVTRGRRLRGASARSPGRHGQ